MGKKQARQRPETEWQNYRQIPQGFLLRAKQVREAGTYPTRPGLPDQEVKPGDWVIDRGSGTYWVVPDEVFRAGCDTEVHPEDQDRPPMDPPPPPPDLSDWHNSGAQP